MANPFDAPLPSVGQKPWTLNPAIIELRGRQGTVEDVINTGRLSPSGLADEIAAAAASIEVNDATVADLISEPTSDTSAAIDAKITPIAEDVSDLNALTSTGRLGEAGLSATMVEQIGQVGPGLFASSRIMRPTGPLLAVTGDSLQSLYNDNSTSGVSNGGPIISRNLAVRSAGRVLLHQVVSAPGAPISGGASGWLDVQIPAVIANPVKANACLIAIGRNSINPFNFATFTAAITSGCDALMRAGIVPILLTMMPTGASGAPTSPETTNLQRINRWLVTFAAQHGIPIYDQYAVLVEPNGGGIKSAFKNSADNTHLSRDGYEAVALSLLGQGLASLFPPAPPLLPRDSADTTNLNSNALLANTTGYASYGTSGEYAVSLQAPSGTESVAIPGQKYRLTINAGASGDKMIEKTLGAVTPGRTVEVVGYIGWQGFKANGTTFFQVAVSFNSSPETVVLLMNSWAQADGDGVFWGRIVVPAGATTAKLRVIVKNAATTAAQIEFAAVAMRDLTALGAA